MSCRFKRIVFAVLVLLIAISTVFAQSVSEARHSEYKGKTVILHTNDVHGALEGYAKLGALRDSFKLNGADVLLVDAGDFAQGSIYVADSMGLSAIQLMNSVGYDIVGIGNHEFDYGYEKLRSNLDNAKFEILCSDVYDADGSTIYKSTTYRTLSGGAVVGFFEMDTPESQTKANPSLIQGLGFVQGDDLYKVAQKMIDELRKGGADTVICLSHLGVNDESKPNRAIDLMENTTGIDFMIDGHSHTVYSSFEKYPMQQTGTQFAYIGVVILDSESGKLDDYYLIDCKEIEPEKKILDEAHAIMSDVDEKYGVTFATTKVNLDGERDSNRTSETNLGDLVSDSLLWYTNEKSSISVPPENVVAIMNGGGIRTSINAGDISMRDTNDVMPFANTLCVVNVKGSDLLEVLEASTFSTPSQIGGFPQIAGMTITIDTTKEFDAGDLYPSTTYHKPASIKRVTINDVNGKPFDKDATYAVAVNNFCAAGGDTYYALASSDSSFDTGILTDDILAQYITEKLGGVVDETYEKPAGRIKIVQ